MSRNRGESWKNERDERIWEVLVASRVDSGWRGGNSRALGVCWRGSCEDVRCKMRWGVFQMLKTRERANRRVTHEAHWQQMRFSGTRAGATAGLASSRITTGGLVFTPKLDLLRAGRPRLGSRHRRIAGPSVFLCGRA